MKIEEKQTDMMMMRQGGELRLMKKSSYGVF